MADMWDVHYLSTLWGFNDFNSRSPTRVQSEIVEALKRYAEDGLVPGDFLQCVISGDFFGAAMRADAVNINSLGAIAAFIEYHPSFTGKFGSPERMWKHIAEKRR